MNEPNTHRDKLLKSSATFLARWRGASALMWQLTISHKTLDIVLSREGHDGNLMISCLDPSRIQGPIRWKNADIAILPFQSTDGEDGYLVIDHNAGLEIPCGAISVRENVKLR